MGVRGKSVLLESTRSLRISLQALREKDHGLDKHRESILKRVPNINDWSKYSVNSITVKDLAYLTAKSHHELALLRGKHSDVLFHGEEYQCKFDDELVTLLIGKHFELVAHSHPGEDRPVPSPADRRFLTQINQEKSIIISGTTGISIEYTNNEFADYINL